jgi:hypothetical protein
MISPTDLALLDGEHTVLVIQTATAREVYFELVEEDREGSAHIWIGGDIAVLPTDTMAQIMGPRGMEWIQLERLESQKD